MDDLERQLLSRTWFPLARVADVERGPVAAAILGTELVVYPGQHHGITIPSYRVDRLQRYLAWYEKYVKKPSGPTSSATAK